MWNFLRNLFAFRVGQTVSRRAARMVGLGTVSSVIGIIGGWRYMRRHSSAA